MNAVEPAPSFGPTRGRLDEAPLVTIAHSPDSETHFVPIYTPGIGYRRLAVEVTGPEGGHPVVAEHGSPGVALAQSQTGIFWKKQVFAFTTTTDLAMDYRPRSGSIACG